ncbi:MAG TPA: winged helix-turn-helix domain-containing protein [Vicinamibacteria bacterium]
MAQGLPDRAIVAGLAIHPGSGQALRFGSFRFDRANRVLSREDVELPLPPRALGVLEHLLERPGSIVSKSALMDAVWPDTAVTETSLTEAVSLVRQALGDDPQQPAYVQTVHRRGYRFVAPVEVETPSGRAVPLATPAAEPAPAGARGRTREVAGWAGAAAALAVLAAALTRREPATGPRPTRFTIAVSAGDPLPAKAAATLALSPDGRLLAYAADRGEKSQLLLRPLDQFEAAVVPGSAGAAAPFFSPDGRWIGFFAEGRLRKAPVGGGAAQDVAEAAHPFGASWEGDTIVYAPSFRGGLMRVSAVGGAAEPITRPDVAAGEMAHLWPETLPGGEVVVFTVWMSGGAGSARLDAVRLRDRARLGLREQGAFARYLDSGHLVFARQDGLLAAGFDARRARFTGPPRAVLSGVALSAQIGMPHVALSREGTLAYVPGRGQPPLVSLGWRQPDGRTSALPVAERTFMNADLAPDGRRVAVTIHDGTRSDVWLADAARGTLSRLTFEGHNVEPVWTADGRHVTYAAGGQGPYNVFRVPADGGGAPERVLKSALSQYPNSWSRDGRVLLFTELHPDTGADLWAFDAAAGTSRPLLRTRFDEDFGVLSPDGRWLAYESNESNRWEVYVRPWPALTPRWQVSAEGGYAPLWSRDGRTLLFQADEGALLAVPVGAAPEPFAGARPRLLARDPHAAWYGARPDGALLSLRETDGASASVIHVVVGWAAELARTLS